MRRRTRINDRTTGSVWMDQATHIWEQRDLLPGLSLHAWSGLGLWGIALALVGGLGAVVGALVVVARTHVVDPVTLGFLILFFAACLWCGLCSSMCAYKRRREIAAGYTTALQGHYEVERRHPPTGVIMRYAGQPALTRVQEEQARRRVDAFLKRR
jgi:ferredoxin